MRLTRLIRLLWATALAALPAGCGKSAGGNDPRPRVVATTTMIGDLVRSIAGDRVRLNVLIGPGIDPHTYKPTTADMGRLAAAQLILYNGLHLEGKMVELFERKLANRSAAVAERIDPARLLAWKDAQSGAHDPHVWFDVSLWSEAARTACEQLTRIDPAGAEHYQANLKSLLERLARLDEYARARLGAIPPQRRVLITSHDAFNYFGRAYGLDVRGIQGISTESEAGLASIGSAVAFILERRIPALFVESSVPRKVIERVQADCRARGLDVKIGGELYSDAMGTEGEHPPYAVHTYEGMMRYNVDKIAEALK